MRYPRIATPVVVAAVALLLAGCGLFASEKPAGSAPVAAEDWSQPDVSEEARQSDVDSCREQARAVVRQEENISADIASRDAQGAFWDESPDLTQNLDAYESRQRYHRVFEDCMRGHGYADKEE
jgi:hypothetical protein